MLTALVLLACSDDGKDRSAGTDSDLPLDSDTDTVGDTETDTLPGAPAFTVAPVLVQAPDPDAPLGWRLTLTASEPVTVTVDVTDDLGVISHGPFETDAALDVWLHGWHPGRTHAVVVTATDADGESATADLAVTAPALPDDFPDIRLVSADPARMEPGVTIVTPTKAALDGASYIIALDGTGLPVWWYAGSGSIHSVEQLPNGNIRYMRNKDAVFVVDLRGTPIAEYHPRDSSPNGAIVDTDALHHDVIGLPDGHLLALSVELRTIADYPKTEENPAVTGEERVAGDVVVEFDAVTGAIYQEWKLLDLLDDNRIAWDAVKGDYWEGLYGGDVNDWSHGNALQYDAPTDRIWVSLRHQDAVVALGRASGQLEAILGNHEGWDAEFEPFLLDPVGATDWPYHTHGHVIGPTGNVLVFDNGNNRTTPPELPAGPTTSRAAEYAVDIAAGTTELVWQWEDGSFSGSLGNVQLLPATGNVLVVYGNVATKDETEPGVHIYEVTHTEPAEIVRQYDVYPAPVAGAGVTTYRAVHWPSLQIVPGY